MAKDNKIENIDMKNRMNADQHRATLRDDMGALETLAQLASDMSDIAEAEGSGMSVELKVTTDELRMVSIAVGCFLDSVCNPVD